MEENNADTVMFALARLVATDSVPKVGLLHPLHPIPPKKKGKKGENDLFCESQLIYIHRDHLAYIFYFLSVAVSSNTFANCWDKLKLF